MTGAQLDPPATATGPDGGVRQRLGELLAGSPALPLAGLAIALFLYLAGDEGGFRGTTFLPATLLLAALLAIGLLVLPRPSPTRAATWAVGLFAAYAAWSYLSILWADQQGMAWDGANRTVLYAIVFALFALWPVKGRAAAVLLGAYALGVAIVGGVELLRVAASSDPVAFLDEGRLSEPTGYANANVALWFSALWPALVLASRREVHFLLRGAFLGSATLLTALAILGQSRSWLAVLPLMVVVVLVAVPGRARTIVALGLLGAAALAMLDPLLDAYRGFDGRTPPSEHFAGGAHAALLASGLLALVGAGWGLLDRSVAATSATARRASVAVFVAFALVCAAGLVAFTASQGSPLTVAGDVWDDFRQGGGEPHFDDTRFGLDAGSYRYDYFRVAWDEFTAHPVLGVGSDNYGRQYLLDGRSGQTPAYPHNLILRVLSMTGLVGFLLFMGAIAAALVAAIAAMRRSAGLGPAAAGIGITLFAYFVLHGSLDWLWEFPALGCAAFAALGLATAIRETPVGTATVGADAGAGTTPAAASRATAVAVAVGALVLCVGVVPPWLAERDLRTARTLAADHPEAALDHLDRSADLNPLSPTPLTTAGAIEARRDRFSEAKTYFDRALGREADDPFVYLQLGAIAAAEDRRADAAQLIDRARELSPTDRVARRVQRQLRAGRFVTPQRVNELILRDIDRRIGPR
jgi:O-antigen ligase